MTVTLLQEFVSPPPKMERKMATSYQINRFLSLKKTHKNFLLSDKMNHKGVHLPYIQKSEDAKITAVSYHPLRSGLIVSAHQTALLPQPTLPPLKARNHNSV